MPKKSNQQKEAELLRLSKPETLVRFDKLRAYYLDGIALSEDEGKQLDNLRKAFAHYSEFPSKQETVSVLMRELELSQSACYLLLRNAIKFFGDLEKVDKAGERAAAYEYYMKLANLAKIAGEYETAMKCKERADKLLGLFEPDTSKRKSPLNGAVINLIFSSKKETLQNQHEEKEDSFEIIE